MAHDFERVRAEMEFFERTGQGADTAFDPDRKQSRQEIEQEVRVGEAFGRGPVRTVHIFFDAGAMELSVREPVYGEHIATVPGEPDLEFV